MKHCQKLRSPLYILHALVAFGYALAMERVVTLARTQYTGTWNANE